MALLVALGVLLVGAGCGTDAQTLRPYTPGEGINVDVGNSADPNAVVHVRNLLVISKAPGEGILSASIVTGGRDALTGVSGVAIKGDGSNGATLTAAIPSSIALADGVLVVLTDNPANLVTLRSADLAAGLTAELTLTFENAGAVTLRTTVVDGNEPHYATIGPSASGTPAE